MKKVNTSNGGCWFCYTKTEEMIFDTEFDTYLHEECLRNEIKENPDNLEANLMSYLIE